MIFFDPTAAMLRFIVQQAGKNPVYDIGSGQGHLVRLLMAKKCKVLGIEPMWAYLESFDPRLPVLPKEAQRVDILRTHPGLCIFARPCHSGFVEEVIKLIHPGSRILYIGLERNLSTDLPSYVDTPQLKQVSRCLGKSGERIFEILRKVSHGKDVKVKTGPV